MKTNKIIILTLFLILINMVSADLQMSLSPINDEIFEDEIALFELKIVNNDDIEYYFERPSTSEIDWITYTSPGSIVVPAKSTEFFNLTLDPKITVNPGQQEVLVSFKSSSLDKPIILNTLIFVKSLTQFAPEYKISIALGADAPYDVDPRISFPVSIYLRNRNPISINNLTISIQSDLISKELTFPFKPMEEKTDQIMFELDRYQEPVTDEIEVQVIINNKTFNQKSIPIRIISYTELEEEISVKKSFLKTSWNIKLKNEGNVLNDGGYNFPLKSFANIFTNTEPMTELVQGDQKYRHFDLKLEPLEVQELYIETNYRGILYALILIILTSIIYYGYRSPIILKKRIIPIQREDEGITEFHVRLLVMNRTKHAVENIGITEIVPRIVSVIREQNVGTLEPSKVIKHDKKGTLLKWEINYLEPYEERIITFKIMSKLGIVGSLVLPKTKCKYETSKGVHRITYSGKESLKI